MTIDKDSAVTIQYKLSDEQGRLLEESKHPVAYLHGGYGNIFPKVEEALKGQDVGYQATLTLAAADAFGARDEGLAISIPKSEFPPGIKVGGQIERHGEDGRIHVFTVLKVKGSQVLLDGNHPLAGKNLRMAIKVLEVRAASEEEIAHRHVHGAHGHHH